MPPRSRSQLFRHRDRDPSVTDNAVVALARKRLPLTDRYHGGRIVARVNGRRTATPLLIVLVAIGTTDFLFALDSIPAVYGVTRHPYIVLAVTTVASLVAVRREPGRRAPAGSLRGLQAADAAPDPSHIHASPHGAGGARGRS